MEEESVTQKAKAATIYEALVRLYYDMKQLKEAGEGEVKVYGRLSETFKTKYKDLKDQYDTLKEDITPYKDYLPNIRFVTGLDDIPDNDTEFVDVDFYLYSQINPQSGVKNNRLPREID